MKLLKRLKYLITKIKKSKRLFSRNILKLLYKKSLNKYLDYYGNQGYRFMMFDKYDKIMVSKKMPDRILNGSFVFYFNDVDYLDDSLFPKWTQEWQNSLISIEEYKNDKTINQRIL